MAVRTAGLEGVEAVLEDGIRTGVTPGAVALVRQHGRTVLHVALGSACLPPQGRPMLPDTVFDLASLTKPLAATPVILRLVEEGLLDLDAPISAYLPEFQRAPLGGSTVAQFLTHTSGVPAHVPVYTRARTRHDVLRVIASLPLSSSPGTNVEYSCLGFITLGILAERRTGSRLDILAESLLFHPLGLAETTYRPNLPPHRYAATERGNDFERAGASTPHPNVLPWRTDYVPGAVHDGNAYYAMGGVSGNAGLFSTAHEVGVLGQMWLDGGEYGGVQVLRSETVARAVSDLTPHLNAGRGLGWLVARLPDEGDTSPRSSGSLLGPRTFGHTGFTGTSLWIDPDAALVVVLLTNRVHPRVGDAAPCIRLRHDFHNAVALALTSDY